MAGGIIGFVPARGSSRGIPGKNLRCVGGVPLVVRAIETLRQVRELHTVILSTDCERIAQLGRRHGAEVPFLRPPHLATDTTPILEVLHHALLFLEETGRTVRWIVMVQPTSPFVTPGTVKAALAHAQKHNLPVVQTVSPVKEQPAWMRVPKGDLMTPFLPHTGSLRRQDLPSLVVLNGAVNVYRSDVIRAKKLPGATGYLTVGRTEGLDIDEEHDLQLAELIAQSSYTGSAQGASFPLGPRRVGPRHPVCVVAEIGVNHNGDPAVARELVHHARAAGADAVKIQLFDPEELARPDAELCAYQKGWGAQNQRELLRSLALSERTCRELLRDAQRLQLPLFASVFDLPSLKRALSLGFPVLKFGSGELTCLPLHRKAAEAGLPVILSCGMATGEEICAALLPYREAGTPLVLLHCVSAYPAPEGELNLRSLQYLRERFGCLVGFSDHTEGSAAACLAVACGAVLIEKHFTLKRSLPGPDHRCSLCPSEFRAFVKKIRETEKILGHLRKGCTDAERDARHKVRKSIVLRRALCRGEKIQLEDLAFLRPEGGISPLQLDSVVGRCVRHSLPAGHVLTWQDL